LYSTGDGYNRHNCWTPSSNYSAPAGGIYWAAENNGYANNRMVENIKIYNNFINRTSPAFGWFHDDSNTFLNNSYKNINIYYNTVFNLKSYECFYLQPYTGSRNPPSGCVFINNIIPKGRYQDTIRNYFTNSSDYSDTTRWIFEKNCFIDGYPSGFPSLFYLNNKQGNPFFINSNFNIPDSFKIKSNSICRDSGLVISGIDKDYWYMQRDNTPCIGFHEYGGISKITRIENEISDKFSLSQNFPNPFNPVTNIAFSLPKSSFVNLVIYDILGREIETLIKESLSPGKYIIEWNATAYPSGIYFYKLQVENFSDSKQMILIK